MTPCAGVKVGRPAPRARASATNEDEGIATESSDWFDKGV